MFLVIYLQTMLCNPVLEGAINMEAVEMLKHSPHAYGQMTQDCVAASQRVEGWCRLQYLSSLVTTMLRMEQHIHL